jgi:hypothetical protein
VKVCPGCGSIDASSESICGVCGRNLAEVPTEPLEAAELEARARLSELDATRPERTVPLGGLVLLSSGLAVIGTGVILAELIRWGVLGFLLIGPGMFLTVVGIDLIIGDIRPPGSWHLDTGNDTKRDEV